MEISLLALLGISLAAMFFGYFFGLFEGRGQGYKKRKTEEASDPSLRAALQVPPPSPPVPVSPPSPAPAPVDNSLLRLSVDAREQPCLDLDGQRVNTAQMAPHQRKRLIDLMLVMRPWVEATPAQRQAVPIPPPPSPAVPQPSPAPVAQVPVPRSTGPLLGGPTPAEPVSAPTTMVGQIDAILQARLAGTPLATRGIRLMESAQGGAMVLVGLNRYPGVGDVPDPEVQAAIRAAIAEWEKKYTPG